MKFVPNISNVWSKKALKMRIDVFVAGWEIPPDFWVAKQGIIQAHFWTFLKYRRIIIII